MEREAKAKGVASVWGAKFVQGATTFALASVPILLLWRDSIQITYTENEIFYAICIMHKNNIINIVVFRAYKEAKTMQCLFHYTLTCY